MDCMGAVSSAELLLMGAWMLIGLIAAGLAAKN